MADLADGESTEMRGSVAKPYVLRNAGGVYSCSCPAWPKQSTLIERRTCKHLRKLSGDDAERLRLGVESLGAAPVEQKLLSHPAIPKRVAHLFCSPATGTASQTRPTGELPPLSVATIRERISGGTNQGRARDATRSSLRSRSSVSSARLRVDWLKERPSLRWFVCQELRRSVSRSLDNLGPCFTVLQNPDRPRTRDRKSALDALVSTAHRGGVGVCLSSWNDHRILVRR
jgi:hypothetical protein